MVRPNSPLIELLLTEPSRPQSRQKLMVQQVPPGGPVIGAVAPHMLGVTVYRSFRAGMNRRISNKENRGFRGSHFATIAALLRPPRMSNGEVDVAHSPPFDILRFKPPLPLLLSPVPRERLLLGFVYPFGRPRADGAYCRDKQAEGKCETRRRARREGRARNARRFRLRPWGRGCSLPCVSLRTLFIADRSF